MNEAGYAQSQGMRLLKQVVETIGPLFTVEQVRSVAMSPPAASGQGLTPQRINGLLSQLAQA
ncbi:MAG: hypothetical protein JW934_20650, partial [Anaerolineae bacterium]|nr:hypothetical protein [Anaerolineae bacterium]